MKILTIGDIVSKQGCEYLRSTLPSLKRELGADIVIANGENSAVGNGILPQSAEFILDCGVDLITLGNHSLKRREIYDYLDSPAPIIRPANYHSSAPGRGMEIIDKSFCKIAVINLQGAVYLDPIENPFSVIDKLTESAKDQGASIIIIDFHAEATAEKRAMGFYVDGKVSAIFGTHTHTQTSDNQILPNGTGYITDIAQLKNLKRGFLPALLTKTGFACLKDVYLILTKKAEKPLILNLSGGNYGEINIRFNYGGSFDLLCFHRLFTAKQ